MKRNKKINTSKGVTIKVEVFDKKGKKISENNSINK